MSKSYNVNYMLAISRLPDHFYHILHNLKGRDALYQNPGASLRSYILANCVRKEYVQISGPLLLTIQECDEFSRNAQVLSNIVEYLQKEADTLCLIISNLVPNLRSTLVMYTLPLHEYSQVVKLSFDSFIMTQDPAKDHVDIMSLHGTNLKSAMFDLQDLIEQVTAELQTLPTKA